jgi:mono/diheme cytochrome c family protein
MIRERNPLPPGEVAAKPTERAPIRKAAAAATRSRAFFDLDPLHRFAVPLPRWGGFLIAASLLAIPAFAQQDTKIENPFRGVMQDRTARTPDERLYVEKCSMCHRQMGMGTVILARRMDSKVARLEVRTDLTAEYITLTVRQGIGNMPRISRAEVSDAQLARIAGYLTKVRVR